MDPTQNVRWGGICGQVRVVNSGQNTDTGTASHWHWFKHWKYSGFNKLWGWGPPMGPQLGSRFQNFLIFSIFFLRKFFFKGKFFFPKVVHFTIKMISILTLSQKRKCQLFRDPNCGPTVGCGPHTLWNPGNTGLATGFLTT